MKISLYILFVVSVFAFYSCSDTFLYDKTEITEYKQDTIFIFETPKPYDRQIELTEKISSEYTVAVFPKYIEFDSMKGNFTNGKTTLHFHSNDWTNLYLRTGCPGSQLILNVKDVGLVNFPVLLKDDCYSKGYLEFPNYLDFEKDSIISYSFTNKGNEAASWTISKLPEWITVNTLSGIIEPSSSQTIIFHADRKGKAPGIYNAKVQLQFSNNYIEDFSIYSSILITEYAEKDGMQKLDGYILDADYFQNEDNLLLLSADPNRLTIINTVSNEQKIIQLPHHPTAFAISDDKTLAAVTYDKALFSLIDLKKNIILKEYQLLFHPFDIAFGTNNWCYISSNENDYNPRIISIELSTGKLFNELKINEFYNSISLKKIPNHKILTAIPKYENGRFVYCTDISHDTLSGDYDKTEFIENLNDFWYIKNGDIAINNSKNIFQLTMNSERSLEFSSYGNLNGEFKYVLNIFECSELKQLLILINENYYSTSSDTYVSVRNLSTFEEIKQIFPGKIPRWSMYLRYAFLNSTGTKIFMISNNLMTSYAIPSDWILETREI